MGFKGFWKWAEKMKHRLYALKDAQWLSGLDEEEQSLPPPLTRKRL